MKRIKLIETELKRRRRRIKELEKILKALDWLIGDIRFHDGDQDHHETLTRHYRDQESMHSFSLKYERDKVEKLESKLIEAKKLEAA